VAASTKAVGGRAGRYGQEHELLINVVSAVGIESRSPSKS
jgi:hypothetical protein